MASPYPFAGLAGETIRRFAALPTLLTLLPALILTAILAVISHYLGQWLRLPFSLSMVLSIIVTSPVLGKSALAARDGDLEAGFLSNWNLPALAGFVARYALLNLAWGIPVSLIAQALLANATGGALPLLGITSGRAAMLALGLLVVVVIFVLAPTITLIIATRTQTIPECFSGETWKWLLARRGDLPAFYAAMIGGLIVFAVLTLPLLLALAALAFAIRTQAGLAMTVLVYVLPAVAGPVLWGRLAGAFVLSEAVPEPVEPARARKETALPSAPQGPESAPAASAAEPAGIDFAQTIKRLALTADPTLPVAIAEAEAIRAKAPGHAEVLAELAKLYLRGGRTPEAIATASDALSSALSGGATTIAIGCYTAFAAHRRSLVLKPAELEQLARGLLEQSKFADAAACFAAFAKSGGEPIRVQKGLIATAEAANKAGHLQHAARIYEFVIQSAPGSTLAEYCQGPLATIKNKLKKSSA